MRTKFIYSEAKLAEATGISRTDIIKLRKEMQKGKLRRGWGAVYANAKIGKSLWQTSIFPDRHSVTYILPLKKQIRFEENLYDGVEVNISIEIWF